MGSRPSKDKQVVPRPEDKRDVEKQTEPRYCGDYTDPGTLAAAQEKYATSNREYPLGNDKGMYPPYPTPTKRSEIYNRERMRELDEHAIKVSGNPVSSSHSELVRYLTKMTNTDVGKARVIYKWLISQHFEEEEIQDDPSDDTVLYDLLLVRAKRQTLNHLLYKLYRIANLPCELVVGSNKPWGYYYGGDLVDGHTWCAVYVGGGWRPVDAHLGMNFLLMGNMFIDKRKEKRNKLSRNTPRALEQLLSSEQRLLTVDFTTDFFFLTDPHVFVYYNLPDDPKWQLLALRLTRDQFKDHVFLTPFYFEFQLGKLSHMTGIVDATKGHVVLELTLPKQSSLRCTHTLEKVAGSSILGRTRDGDIKHMCFLENQGSQRKFHVSVSEIGRYRLTVFVTDLDSSSPQKHQVFYHYLEFTKPNFKAVASLNNPRCEHGPGADTIKYQVIPKSHHAANIVTEDGSVCVSFHCDSDNRAFLRTELLSSHLPKEKLERYIVNSMNEDGELNIFIKCPEAGKYLLNLFVRDPVNRSNVSVCSYLITAKVGFYDVEPFPQAVSGFIGDVSFQTTPWLKPLSHPKPILQADDTGEISITMSIVQGVELDIQLDMELVFPQGKDQDVSEFIWYTCKHGKLGVEATFPEAGTYGISIFGKEKGKDEVLKHIWKYLVHVTKPCADIVPYPTPMAGWNSVCELRSPLSGYLVESQEVHFEVKVPWATEVAIMTESWACEPLSQSNDGWFKGTLSTKNVGNITLSTLDENTNYLLQYKVLNSREHQKMLARQKQSQERAIARQRTFQNRRDEELNAARTSEKEAEENVSEQATIFNREKERYVADEKYHRSQEMENWKIARQQYCEKLLTNQQVGKTDAQLVTQEARAIREEQNSEMSARRSIHKGIRTYLVRERLREGTRLEDYMMLKPALESFLNLGLEEQGLDLTKAKKTMVCLQAKQDLESAMRAGDPVIIQERIDAIYKKGLYGRLQVKVQEAERLVNSLQRIHRLKLSVLGIDKNTMGEIRSYSRPPDGVHKVMQASFLLLEQDEYTTSEWSTCQKMCTVLGRENVNRRILDLNIQDLHPEVLTRVEEILTNLDFSYVKRLSAGAAAFYVWALGTAEEANKIIEDSDQTRAPPADVKRQREIFGKASLSEKELNTWGRLSRTPAILEPKKKWTT